MERHILKCDQNTARYYVNVSFLGGRQITKIVQIGTGSIHTGNLGEWYWFQSMIDVPLPTSAESHQTEHTTPCASTSTALYKTKLSRPAT